MIRVQETLFGTEIISDSDVTPEVEKQADTLFKLGGATIRAAQLAEV